jgi:hypothetical protein
VFLLARGAPYEVHVQRCEDVVGEESHQEGHARQGLMRRVQEVLGRDWLGLLVEHGRVLAPAPTLLR